MFYHTTEYLCTLTNKLCNRLVSDSDTQWQRIDEHTEGVGSTHIATPITDSRQVATMIACIACHGIEGSCQHQGSRRYSFLTGIAADCIHIERRAGRLHHSFGLLALQVGSQFTGTLEVSQHRSIVLTIRFKVFRSLKALLVGHKVEIGIAFLLHRCSLESSAQLLEEDICRCSVESQMMEVGKQADSLWCADDSKAAERSCSQMERTNEVALIDCQFFFRHRQLFYNGLTVLIAYLHHIGLCHIKMRMQNGMCIDNGLNGCGQLVHIGILLEAQHRRNVIGYAGRILHTFVIDTRLWEREWRRASPNPSQGGELSIPDNILSRSSFHPLLQNLVLQCFDRGTTEHRLRLYLHTKPLIDLCNQFDAEYRGES